MAEMTGKTVLITGATDGIGKVTAMALASQGASIVGVGRNPQKCERVAAEVRAIPGAGAVEFLVCDLSIMAQVRDLAARVDESFSLIDVLLNNAGGIFYQRTSTSEGLEMTFALDHLSPFLLTNLLLDKLIASSARVVTVSSMMHNSGSIEFDDLNYTNRRYSAWGAYSQAKLANVLFSNELARRTTGTGVTSNSLHPGFVRTAFGSGQPSIFAKATSLASRVVGISAEKGAETSIYLASSPEVASVSGAYYSEGKRGEPKKIALDPQVASRLWQVSAAMTGVQDELSLLSVGELRIAL